MKLCIDCRWINPEDGRLRLSDARCEHPSSVLPGPVSVVTGLKGTDVRLRCAQARANWGSGTDFCGPEARFWEPPQVGFGPNVDLS